MRVCGDMRQSNYIDGNSEDTEHVFSIYGPFYKSQGLLLWQVGSPDLAGVLEVVCRVLEDNMSLGCVLASFCTGERSTTNLRCIIKVPLQLPYNDA